MLDILILMKKTHSFALQGCLWELLPPGDTIQTPLFSKEFSTSKTSYYYYRATHLVGLTHCTWSQ
jgi:hypothetical protein